MVHSFTDQEWIVWLIWIAVKFNCISFYSKVQFAFSESSEAHVERVYCGSLITSLEMAGVSLTLMHLSDLRAECLGSPNYTSYFIS